MAKKYWWEDDEQQDNAQQEKGQRYWWDDDSTAADTAGTNITNRVNTWLKNHNTYISNYNKRYSGRKNSYEDAYVSDSSSWLDTVTKQKSAFDAEADSILAYMDRYKGYLDADWMEEVRKTLTEARDAQSQILDITTKDHEWWSGFGAEDLVSQYGSAEDAYKYYQRAQGYNTKYAGATGDEIQQAMETIGPGEEYDWLRAYRGDVYGNTIRANADFQDYATIGSGLSYTDFGTQTMRRGTSRRQRSTTTIDKYRAASLALAEHYGNEAPLGMYDKYDSQVAIFRTMEDEEFENLAYCIAYDKEHGTNTAEQYVDLMEETLSYRRGNQIGSKITNIDIPVIEGLAALGYGALAGVDNFAFGIEQRLSDKEVAYYPSYYANAHIGEQASGLDSYLHSAATNIGNMAPSILVSATLSGLGVPGKVSEAVGSATMGFSASGNAYKEALMQGYDKNTARLYGDFVGASEGTLQYLLGGISKLGGMSSKMAGKVAAIDDALLRGAAKFGLSIGSEIMEEELQNFLEPAFRTILFGEDYDAPTISEIVETAIVTFLSTGFLEGGGTYKGIKQDMALDKQFSNDYGAVTGDLIQEGLLSDPNSESYKLAEKFQKQTEGENGKAMSGYQIRQLVEANDAQFAVEDYDAAVKTAKDRLTELGETNDVDKLAKLVAKKATGQELTRSEKKALVNSFGSQVAKEMRTASEQTATYKSLEDRVGTEGRFNVSESGRAVIRESKEGFDISKAEVVTVGDGQVTFKTESGTEVYAGDIDFADEDQSYLVSAVSDIENITPAAATAVMHDIVDTSKPLGAQLNGIDEAYTYGYYGYSVADLKAGQYVSSLTDKQMMSAYKLGESARKISDTDADAPRVKMRTAAEAKLSKKEKAAQQKARFESDDVEVYYMDGKTVTKFDEHTGEYDDKRTAAINTAKFLSKMGIGSKYYFFESYVNAAGERVYKDANGNEVEAPNGMYEADGSIYIDLNAGDAGQGTALFTMGHELGHFVKAQSTKQFKVLGDLVTEAFDKTDMSMHDRVVAKQEFLSEKRGHHVTYAEAYEEVVCDALSTMLTDGSFHEKIMEIKVKDKGLFNTIKRFFEKMIAKFKKVYAELTPDQRDAQDIREMKDMFDRIQTAFAEALVEASDNFHAAMESVVEAKAEPVGADEIITDGAVVTDGEGERFSIRSMKHDIAEGKMFEDLKNVCGWTDAQVNTLRTQLKDLVEYMIPYRNILDMNESYGAEGRRFSPYKPNSDPLYKISMDFSTLCSKRLLTQYVIEQLQLRENRPMSAEEQMAIRDMLNEYRKVEKGLQVACAMCYVEAARLKSPKQIQRWLDDPAPLLKDYFGKKNKAFNDSVKKAQADFKESKGYDREAPKKDMKPADVKELNQIGPRMRSKYQLSAEEQAIVERAMSLPNSTYLTAGNLANLSETDPVIYDAYTAFVRTATRSKSLEKDEPYYYGDSARDNGNGIIVTDSFIEAVNRENGMRFSSWSDWRIQHLLDYITAVIDNSVRGAAMHGYTKFGDEVRVLGKTGMMFNMSGVAGTQTGLNEDGSLSFSPTESIDVNEAIQLRDEFPEHAGLQCIGVSNEHIIALLRSDIIDYVIPYHVSGLNAALRRMVNIHGWADYTGTQHASIDKSIKLENAVDKEHWHEEPVFSEFFVGYDTGMTGIEAMRASAEKYKQMCKDRGLTPKFNQFATEDNYWKLLIDRKMINQKTGNLIRQKAVTPTFDFSTIKGVVDKFVENYDAGLEARALNHIVENWDSIPQRIKDLKKHGSAKTKKTAKAVDTLSNQTLAAQPAKNSDRQNNNRASNGSPLTRRSVKQRSVGSTHEKMSSTAAAEILGIENIAKYSDSVKEAVAVLGEFFTSVDQKKPVLGFKRTISASNLEGSLVSLGILKREGTSGSAYRYDDGHALRVSNHSANANNFVGDGEHLSLALFERGKMNDFVDGKSNVIEAVFRQRYLDGNPEMLKQVIHDIAHFIAEGEYHDTAGAMRYNFSGTEEFKENAKKRLANDEMARGKKFSERTNAPVFYSQMGKVVEGMKQEKFGASSVISMLRGRGVKAEEIRWSGIQAFLDGKKSVTKAELLEFIQGSMLHIDEKLLDGTEKRAELPDNYRLEESENEMGDPMLNLYIDGELVDTFELMADDSIQSTGDSNIWAMDEADLTGQILNYYAGVSYDDAYGIQQGPRWGGYKLGGGSNYRELLFKMPGVSLSNGAMEAHWGKDASGVLAHARMQDFDVNGKKMLFIEEIQSDWHNAGHKHGYMDGTSAAQYEELKDRVDIARSAVADAYTEYSRIEGELSDLIINFRSKDDAAIEKWNRDVDAAKERTEKARLAHVQARHEYAELSTELQKLGGKVPDAPFKDNYHEFVLKRLIRMAAEEGYDSIGWTTADIQSQRWSDDFAEGYRIEYDQDIPKFLKKYGKQWGATVGNDYVNPVNNSADFILDAESDIERYQQELAEMSEEERADEYGQFVTEGIAELQNTIERYRGTKVWSMDITPSMKKSVLEEGQALYSERTGDSVSNRSLLANAFEGIVQNSNEYKLIQQYKSHVAELNSLEDKLSEFNREIRKIRFTEGEYDAKKLRDLEEKAKNVAKEINRHDWKLLNLEASEPLRRVIDRERKKASQETRDHVKQIQQNKKDRAEQAELRQKIRKKVRDLDKILNRGNKKQNVKEDMKGFASKALELADYLFTDHVSNDELIRRGIDEDLVTASGKERLVRETENVLSQLYDNADSLTDEQFTKLDAKRKANEDKLRDLLTAQRNRRLQAPVYNLFNDLVTEYSAFKNSKQDAVKAAYNPEVERFLRSYVGDEDSDRAKTLKNMRVADMTTEELWKLDNAYQMVLHAVRTANKLFVKGKTESIEQVVNSIAGDFSNRKIPEKDLAIVAQKLANKIGWNYEKLYYALDRIGSEAFTELFMNLANSENIVMQDIIEAVEFRDQMVEKYGHNNWALNKKIDTVFMDNTGKHFRLTLGEMMALYAYSRREGAYDHLEYGGFMFGKEELNDPNPANTYKLNRDQLKAITDTLTIEQKAYAEEMQKYLSEVMGEKGNEVSTLLYGIKMFGEKNYFPIHVSGVFKAQAQESQAKAAEGFQSMSNAGFTHAQNSAAKAPIILESFDEVWSDHVNEMSRYHGAVPALEDIRRVMNRSFYSDNVADSTAIKQLMINKFGNEAAQYFDNLYREANSGAITDKLQNTSKKLLSLFRKNSVAYSLSVLVQQPASIVRAYAVIDRKYFGFKGVGAISSGVYKAVSSKWNKAYENAYNEMLKYAPGVTMTKEIGGFDTATGGSIRSYLLDTDKSFKQKWKTGTAKEKGMAVLDKVDNNAIANLPNVADKIAWIEIWNACKRETLAKHKDLAPTSDAFMKIVGDRFTEVIRATQVYDSIFAKSPMLKSKNLYVQMLVSFMNEPNTIANMAESAVRDIAKGNRMDGLKKAHVLVHSIIFTGVMKSIIYAMRDDDEDETYIEKYMEALTGSLMDDFWFLNYIPIARDVWSIAQGYDVERTDMAIVSDAIGALNNLLKAANTDKEDMTEDELIELDKKITKASWNLVDALSAFTGIPMKNIRREINAMIDHAKIASANAGKTTAMSTWDTISEAVIDSIPFMGGKSKTDKLYAAIIEGDTEYIERMKATYKTEDAYHTAVRKALRENDPRVKEAAQAQINGDPSKRVSIAKQIIADGFILDDVVAAINSEINAMTPDKESEAKKEKGYYTAADIAIEAANGDWASVRDIKDDIIQTAQKNGKTKDEAEENFETNVRSEAKEAYIAGSLDDATAKKLLAEYTGMGEDEAATRVSYWAFCKDNPKYAKEINESQYVKYTEFAEPAGIPVDVYVQYINGTKDLKSIKDEWGDEVKSKREQVLEVIDSLPLTWKQKDSLYLSYGYSESGLWDVPW